MKRFWIIDDSIYNLGLFIDISLFEPSDYKEEKVSNQQSTFGVIMGLLKYASSMENFQKYIDTHEEVLSNMPVRAAAVLNEFCTLDLSEQELEKDEVINMCQAVREMKEVSRREGRIEGRMEGAIRVYYQKLNYSVQQIAAELGIEVEEVEKVIQSLEE